MLIRFNESVKIYNGMTDKYSRVWSIIRQPPSTTGNAKISVRNNYSGRIRKFDKWLVGHSLSEEGGPVLIAFMQNTLLPEKGLS
jgi:hypothetical protein